jgi:hypothetical protein
MSRLSTRGLHPGTRVHVKSKGKCAKGTVTALLEVEHGDYVEYRCDWHGATHIAQLSNVRQIQRPRQTPINVFDDDRPLHSDGYPQGHEYNP